MCVPGLPDGRGVAKVELHAAHIGLVRDRLGKELQHHGEAEFRRQRRRLRLRSGKVRLDGLDAISSEHLLRFEFGQEGAPACGPGLMICLAARSSALRRRSAPVGKAVFRKAPAGCRCSAT